MMCMSESMILKPCFTVRSFLVCPLVFVVEPAVPPDENAARSLRHLVTSRKIGGGTRFPAGTDTRMTTVSRDEFGGRWSGSRRGDRVGSEDHGARARGAPRSTIPTTSADSYSPDPEYELLRAEGSVR